MLKRIKHLLRLWRLRGLYVTCDSTDNSVTLSRRLFKRLGVDGLSVAKVFVFRLNSGAYAFTLNPDFADDTQTSDIMYNSKHRCIGFESLCPTVCRIFFDYGLPAQCKCKLSVEPAEAFGTKYYVILPPYGKKPSE